VFFHYILFTSVIFSFILSLVQSKLLIHLEVASEDILQGAQQALHGVSVHGHQVAVRFGDHVGCTGLTLDESALSEVTAHLVVHHFRGLFAFLEHLGGVGLAFLKEEQIVSLVSLLDDVVSSLEVAFGEGIRKFRSFIRLHSGENSNFL